MGLLDEVLDHGLVEPGHRDGQLGSDAEALAVIARADADIGRNACVFRDPHLLLAGDELERAEEAGRIAHGEELLGIGAFAATAAEFLRRVQHELDVAGIGRGLAFAAAGGGTVGGIERLHEGVSFLG